MRELRAYGGRLVCVFLVLLAITSIFPAVVRALSVNSATVRFNLKAPSKDTFNVSGYLDGALPMTADSVTFAFGSYSKTIPLADFRIRREKLTYRGSSGITRLYVDAATGRFQASGRNLDLSGLTGAVDVRIEAGGLQECSSVSLTGNTRQWRFTKTTGVQTSCEATGAASGALIVPPSNVLENEPNDTPALAQSVSQDYSVAGHARWNDPGYSVDMYKVEDLYRLDATEPVRINLAISDALKSDLDLFLMDASGNLLAASQTYEPTEMLDTPGAGTFIVGVNAVSGSSAYVLSFGSAATPSDIPPGAEFVPGEILVKRKSDRLTAQRALTSLEEEYGLSSKMSFPPELELMKIADEPLHALGELGKEKLMVSNGETNALRTRTLETIRRLREDPGIEYAEPNFIYRASAVPNDQYYNYQWHYDSINLPQSWNVTSGKESVIIAVIDTGVLLGHPDLSSRLTQGYDFISDPARARDGDGIDPDPNDPGDDPSGLRSSFHGTHVAGTIGAATNNATGVAGVTWKTKVMPLRVLGVEGGTVADIAQAIRFAAGLSNVSRQIPAKRANVINLSLGGPGASSTMQEAVNAARGQGVTIVAAAGNSNSGELFFPASSNGVVSVSAVDFNLEKTYYSNYGSTVDVAAPGGDTSADRNGDGRPDGVYSTMGNDAGEYFYGYYQGTSMASPHVAGVIALMHAVNENMTPGDFDQLLAGTHPATTLRITADIGTPGRDDYFGYGLIDAAKAVAAAQAIAGTAQSGSILSLSADSLNFDRVITNLGFTIGNAGSGTLHINNVSDNASWLTVSPDAGTAPLTVHATVDRTGLSAGTYTATITVSSDAEQGEPDATVQVEMKVNGNTSGNVGRVWVLAVDMDSQKPVKQAVTDADSNYEFTIPELKSGTYLFVAGTDRDNDGYICDFGEACGHYPEPVVVNAGEASLGVDFITANATPVESATPQFGDFPSLIFKRLD